MTARAGLEAPTLPLMVLDELTGLGDAPRLVATILGLMPEAGALVVDADLRVVLMDGPVFARHGYDPVAVRDRPVSEVVPASAWPVVGELWRSALTGVPRTIEHTATDGLGVYVLHFAPLVAEGGLVVGAILIAQDVTARTRAAVELERRHAQQQAISTLGSLALGRIPFGELADAAVKALLGVLAADLAAVYEHTDDGGATPRAVAGDALAPPARTAPPENAPSIVLPRESGRPLLSPDLRTEQRFSSPVLVSQGMVSLVTAPIGVGPQAFGFLGACSRAKDVFSEDDLAFVQSMANVLSAAAEDERTQTRVAHAESRIVDFWDLSLELLAVFAADGTILEANAAWEGTLGWTAAEVVGRNALDLIHPEDRERTGREVASPALAETGVPQIVNRYVAKDGSIRWLRWSVRGAAGGLLYGVATDVTAEVQDRARADARERQLHAAQRIGNMGSWETDVVSRRFVVSESLASMLALDALDVTFDELFAHIHPDDRAMVDAKFAGTALDKSVTEFRALRPDGGESILRSHVEPVVEDGRIVLLRGMVQDVTESRRAELALRRSEERFRQSFENSPIAMALVDPTSRRLVRVNRALCRFLNRGESELTSLTLGDVTHPEEIAADEAVLDDLAAGTITEYAREMRCVRPDGSIVWAALSFSTALDADGDVDVMVAQLLDVTARRADEEVQREHHEEMLWLSEIRGAFVDDRFLLHAQPIIDIANGETVQHELLIRMRDSSGGLVAPGAFLPTAEKYGPVQEIDRWVICRAMAWAAAGTTVSVNLSGVSLGDAGLATYIESELARWGADPARLVFEITEAALLQAGPGTLALAERLRGLGCRLALDNFGTGYGALHHLKAMPFDFLKIDQGFVQEALTSEPDRLVISVVVNLARRFGVRTIAQGVENAETVALLAEMGVDLAQGFHLGRPEPLPEVE